LSYFLRSIRKVAKEISRQNLLETPAGEKKKVVNVQEIIDQQTKTNKTFTNSDVVTFFSPTFGYRFC
jgi:hypothetical protein